MASLLKLISEARDFSLSEFSRSTGSVDLRGLTSSRTFRYLVLPAVALPVLYKISAPIRRRISQRVYTYLIKETSENEAELNKEHMTALYRAMSTVVPTGDQGALKVVEIGPGTGIIFRFFPEGLLYSYYPVEPNSMCRTFLEESLARYPRVRVGRYLIGDDAQSLDYFADSSVDVVIEKHVLCSVDDPRTMLREIKRILKPGGKFIFFEHVAASRGSFLHRVQRFVEPLWVFVFECKLTYDARGDINATCFGKVDCQDYDAIVPLWTFMMRPHVTGYAEKSDD